jgi:hypothetical protein
MKCIKSTCDDLASWWGRNIRASPGIFAKQHNTTLASDHAAFAFASFLVPATLSLTFSIACLAPSQAALFPLNTR